MGKIGPRTTYILNILFLVSGLAVVVFPWGDLLGGLWGKIAVGCLIIAQGVINFTLTGWRPPQVTQAPSGPAPRGV